MIEVQQEPHGTFGNSVLAFLCGAAIGAGVALLYTPMSGRRARAQITQSANQVIDTADEWKDQAVERVGEWREKAMSSAHNTLERAADTIKSAGDRLAPDHTG